MDCNILLSMAEETSLPTSHPQSLVSSGESSQAQDQPITSDQTRTALLHIEMGTHSLNRRTEDLEIMADRRIDSGMAGMIRREGSEEEHHLNNRRTRVLDLEASLGSRARIGSVDILPSGMRGRLGSQRAGLGRTIDNRRDRTPLITPVLDLQTILSLKHRRRPSLILSTLRRRATPSEMETPDNRPVSSLRKRRQLVILLDRVLLLRICSQRAFQARQQPQTSSQLQHLGIRNLE